MRDMGRTGGSAGFSLVEIVVSMGLVSVAVLASTSYFSNSVNVSRIQRTTASKDGLSEQIRQALTNPATIRRSMADSTSPTNIALLRCLAVTGSMDCASNANGVQTPFNVFSPVTGERIAGTDGTQGTANDPVCYDAHGKALGSCMIPGSVPPILSPSVAFRVIAYYRVICPQASGSLEPAPNCDVAETTTFGFDVLSPTGVSMNSATSGAISHTTEEVTKQVNPAAGPSPSPGCHIKTGTVLGCDTANIPDQCIPISEVGSVAVSDGFCMDSYTGSNCLQTLVYRILNTRNAAGNNIVGISWTPAADPPNCTLTTGVKVPGQVRWECCPASPPTSPPPTPPTTPPCAGAACPEIGQCNINPVALDGPAEHNTLGAPNFVDVVCVPPAGKTITYTDYLASMDDGGEILIDGVQIALEDHTICTIKNIPPTPIPNLPPGGATIGFHALNCVTGGVGGWMTIRYYGY